MSTFLDRSRDGAIYLPNHVMLPLLGTHRSFSGSACESIAACVPDTRHWCTYEAVHATGAPFRMQYNYLEAALALILTLCVHRTGTHDGAAAA
jgi:hypothetical protein